MNSFKKDMSVVLIIFGIAIFFVSIILSFIDWEYSWQYLRVQVLGLVIMNTGYYLQHLTKKEKEC